MDETLRGAREFHRAFHCHISPNPLMPALGNAECGMLMGIAQNMELIARACIDAYACTEGPAKEVFLRLHLLQEELSELARAMEHENIYEALDAVTDIQYVLDGTYLALGLHELKLPAFREVHRSNMTKLDKAGLPTVNEVGRIMKGPNFEPPRLKELMYRLLYGGTDPNEPKEQ